MITITINEEGKRLVATIAGDLDNSASSEAERGLTPVFECTDRDVVIDCSGLNYISSSGLRIFLNVFKHCRSYGHKAILRHPNEVVLEIFCVGGFLQLFERE